METATKTAVIGGVFVLAAAVIGGVFQLAGRVSGSTASPSTTNHHPGQVRSTPSSSQSITSPSPQPVTSSPATPKPAPSPKVTAVTPVEQRGWSLNWHDHVSIQPQGIVITSIGPQTSNGSDYDIQYVPGNGWEKSNNTVEMDNWPSTIRPGPSTINGFIIGGGATTYPEKAQVGEMLDWMNQANNMVGYMYVTNVNSAGVEVDMWVWTKNGS